MNWARTGSLPLIAAHPPVAEVKQRSVEGRLQMYAPTAGDNFAGALGIAGPGQGLSKQTPEEKSQQVETMPRELKKQKQPIGH